MRHPKPRHRRSRPANLQGRRAVRLAAATLSALLVCAAPALVSAQSEPTSAPGQAAPGAALDPADRVLYLVLTDRFANGDPGNDGEHADPSLLLGWHGGDFRGLTEHLGYLAELGVNTIWITPIVEQIDHPVESPEHPPHWGYHGYWAEDFDRLEPSLGTEADLRTLLDAAHEAGLEVVLDVVLNHSGYGSHLAQDPEMTRECPEEWTDDLTMCLFGLPDFRTEDPAVARRLIDWQVAWLARFPFDGLRADTVKHVETEVWREFLAAVRAARPDERLWTLGESWGTEPRVDEPLLAEGLFDAMFDFQFSEYVESFLSGRMRAAAAAHHLERRNDPAIGRYVHYLDTHDTVPMTDRLESESAYQVALVLLFTNAGMPLLYYGDELAREGSAWPNNRPDMPWDKVEGAGRATLELTRQLTQIRRDHPALSRGSWTTLQAEEGLLAFAREVHQDDADDRVVVAVNRGPEAASVSCGEGVGCEPLLCLRCQVAEGQVILEANGAVVLASQ